MAKATQKSHAVIITRKNQITVSTSGCSEQFADELFAIGLCYHRPRRVFVGTVDMLDAALQLVKATYRTNSVIAK